MVCQLRLPVLYTHTDLSVLQSICVRSRCCFWVRYMTVSGAVLLKLEAVFVYP
jgi:hypothetical protein